MRVERTKSGRPDRPPDSRAKEASLRPSRANVVFDTTIPSAPLATMTPRSREGPRPQGLARVSQAAAAAWEESRVRPAPASAGNRGFLGLGDRASQACWGTRY